MVKYNKYILFILTMMISIVLINWIIIAQVNPYNEKTYYDSKPPLIGEGVYLSNRYSLPEDYTENQKNESITEEDELVSENEHFELYLDRNDVLFKVKDKRIVNGRQYVWSSAISQVKNSDANYQNAQFMLSSFVVEYFNINQTTGEINKNTSKAFLHTAETGSGYYDHKLSENVKILYQPIDSGIQVDVVYSIPYKLSEETLTANISFSAEVRINDMGLHVNIPNSTILEDKLKIAAIYVMPFLGATRLDDIPGYMFVPDGTGALIRHEKHNNSNQLVFKYYGNNDGAGTLSEQLYKTETNKLSMPVFGSVHGVNQNAFLGVIENGDFNAELLVNRNINNIIKAFKYNWITPRFIMRDIYNLYKVNQTIEDGISPEDIAISYNFLVNEDANYVGMAKSYQDYLVNNGDLVKHNSASTPIRLEILASDSSKGLFGPKIKTMTTVEDIYNMVSDLEKNQVSETLLVIKGWNKGGMSGNSPYPIRFEKSVGSQNEFYELIDDLNKKEIPTYFYNDYVIGYENSKKVDGNDIAKGLHRVQLSFETPSEPVYKSYYYLYPESSYDIAKNDSQYYTKHKIEKIALDTIGHTLFSYYDDKTNFTRYDALINYENILSLLNENFKVSLYQPNAYMWKYTENYFDVPMYSSQHLYYTDTIPFLQVVLKGYINYYAPYSNYFINPSIQRLQLIDYGMYPSFILTEEDTYELKYTNANHLYTTKYNDFKDKIIEEFTLVNDTLGLVSDATIESRTTLAPGIIKIDYSNQVSFIINYTTEDYDYQGKIVKAIDILKIGVM